MRIGLFIAVALLTGTATFGTARAASKTQNSRCTSAQTSVYGTIKSAAGSTFSLNATDDVYGRYIRTTRVDGTLLIHAASARVRSDGLTIRPGVFAGIFGCFSGSNNFKASQVTLATSIQTYPYRHGRIVDEGNPTSGGRQTIAGTVLSNGGLTNKIVITMANGRQIAVFTSELRAARIGDRVSATGYINSKGSFQASSARDLSRP